MSPGDDRALQAGGEQRDGDGEVFHLAAHCHVESKCDDPDYAAESAEKQWDHDLMGRLVAGVARRSKARSNHDAVAVERRAGLTRIGTAHSVKGKATSQKQIAIGADHAVRNVKGREITLTRSEQVDHLSVCANADTVDVKLVASRDVLRFDSEVARSGPNVDMH